MDLLTGRIVVGYDGSDPSCAAVDWAAVEARRRGQPLVVLHVVDYLGLMPNAMGPVGWPGVFADDAAKIAAQGADRARHHVPDLDVTPLTEITGVAGALIEASKAAALLVVGTHGHGPLPGTLLGSVALTVSGHGHCPVAVVRGNTGRRTGADRPVIVGFDGSPASAAAVQYAATVAADTTAPLTVITAYQPVLPRIRSGADRVRHPGDSAHPDFEAIARAAAHDTAIEAVPIARRQHPDLPVTQRVIRGSAADILASAAARAGLLVVGSRGHGGFTGLVLGSVSHRLIHSSPCPVVIVHGGIRESENQPAQAFVAEPT